MTMNIICFFHPGSQTTIKTVLEQLHCVTASGLHTGFIVTATFLNKSTDLIRLKFRELWITVGSIGIPFTRAGITGSAQLLIVCYPRWMMLLFAARFLLLQQW
jgi:hypothetical protein